jgi:hypothetical protein
MEKVKAGSWLTVIGGALITIVSARVAYEHIGTYVFYDFADKPLQYHYLINLLANHIGYFLLFSSLLVMAGALLSFRANASPHISLLSLAGCGLSTCGGALLWVVPHPPAAVYLNVEDYAPFFFLGVILSFVGGVVLAATFKPFAEDHM